MGFAPEILWSFFKKGIFIYLGLSGHGSYRSRSLLYEPNNNYSKLNIIASNHKICLNRELEFLSSILFVYNKLYAASYE